MLKPDSVPSIAPRGPALTWLLDAAGDRFPAFGCTGIYTSYNDALRQVREQGTYSRVGVYVDGANLLRSLAYFQEQMSDAGDAVRRRFSIRREHYQHVVPDADFRAWFLSWCAFFATEYHPAQLMRFVYVMCVDEQRSWRYVRALRRQYGVDVVVPAKEGAGAGSSAAEDETLKSIIARDLHENTIDHAIIGTGDGKRTNGQGFPDLAQELQLAGKTVIFIGFSHTASNKITKHFDFIDLATPAFFPRAGPTLFERSD
jgi:threonine dehydrogenase-like Zn-dependent dehydrogenase